MDELNKLKVKAITETIKQKINEDLNDFMVGFVLLFKSLSRPTQKIWVDKLEEQYNQKIPTGNQVPNLYDIGLAYLRWQIFLDLYTNGFEVEETD